MRIQRWSLAVTAGLTAVIAGIFAIGGDPWPLLWYRQTPDVGLLADAAADPPWPVIDRYCVACHNEIDLAGGFSFEKLDRKDVPTQRRGLGSGGAQSAHRASCPRWASRGPSARRVDGMAALARARARRGVAARAEPRREASRAPEPHRVRERDSRPAGVRRERDREHAAAGRRPSAGSTTTRLALSVSPTLLEGYARPRCKSAAAPSATARWATARFAIRRSRGAAQQRHIEGLPLGTRGGRRRRAHVPAGRRVRIRRVSIASGRRLGKPDRREWSSATDRRWTSRSTARPFRSMIRGASACACRRARSASRSRSSMTSGAPASTSSISARWRSAARCGRSTINGPFDATGRRRYAEPPRDLRLPSRHGAPRRRRARNASSARLADTRISPSRCKPASDEIGQLMRFYRMGREEGGDFDVGIQYALSRMLVDPRFLYRFEREPEELAVGDVYRIGDSRARVAAVVFSLEQHPGRRAALRSPRRTGSATPRKCSRRKSSACWRTNAPCALVENFASQWLQLRELDELVPQDPDFDDGSCAPRCAARRSSFSQTCCASRAAFSICSTRTTRILNERLAAHYGIDGVRGSQMRRVALAGGQPAARCARPRQHPHGDVGAESHVARRARAVAHAELARREGAEPAAGRRGRSLGGSQRIGRARGQHGARAVGDASRESDLCGLSRASWTRSAWRSRTSTCLGAGASKRTATHRCLGRRWSTARSCDGPGDLRGALLSRSDVVRRRQ